MVKFDKNYIINSLSKSSNLTMKDFKEIEKISKDFSYYLPSKLLILLILKNNDIIEYYKKLNEFSIQFIDRKFLKKTIEEGNSNNEIKEVFDDLEFINSPDENSFLDWILKTKSIKNQDILDSENRWDELNLTNLKVSSSSKKKITREDYMTETLAKVYVRQEKYKEALKAYKILSLKYPEKISLFANQIKELKKRLKNE
ncbi:MAG: hypothetical protein CMC62_00155 [Flavobacteriaceae bacterium]|nr:hypothetical protein [Flavobacteriaceae bacterium]|tara:strand:- start:1770 stop:2369 length:600 start_codon:yes stop_codon:yes gene_type:complete